MTYEFFCHQIFNTGKIISLFIINNWNALNITKTSRNNKMQNLLRNMQQPPISSENGLFQFILVQIYGCLYHVILIWFTESILYYRHELSQTNLLAESKEFGKCIFIKDSNFLWEIFKKYVFLSLKLITNYFNVTSIISYKVLNPFPKVQLVMKS